MMGLNPTLGVILRYKPPIVYLLNDQFGGNLAAGAVNGTPATPGPGTRDNVDSESKLSVAGGVLVCAGGKASPALGDPIYRLLSAFTRVAGKVVLQKITIASGQVRLGVVASGGTSTVSGPYMNGTTLTVRDNATSIIVGVVSFGVLYSVATVLRTVGAYSFIKGGAYTNWTYLLQGVSDATATLQIAISNFDAVYTSPLVDSPQPTWLPTPLAYAAFGGAAGALGNTDSAGPDSQGAPVLAWTGATWAIVSHAAVNTPTLTGSELVVNGNMETGSPPSNWTPDASVIVSANADTPSGSGQSLSIVNGITQFGGVSQAITLVSGAWYRISVWVKRITSNSLRVRLQNSGADFINVQKTGSTSWAQYIGTGRSPGTVGNAILQEGNNVIADQLLFDDVSVQRINLTDLFGSISSSTVDNINSVTVGALPTTTSTPQVGLISRLDSAATPTQGIVAYFDGAGNVKLDEFTTATTWNNLLSTAKAFTAGDTLTLDLSGSAWRLYHITAAGVATLLGSGTTAVTTGNLVGIFSTYSGNTVTKFQSFAKGTNGEYSGLNVF